METIRQKIALFMKGKEEVSVKEIFEALPEIKQKSIYGILYDCAKKNVYFAKTKKGHFKLNEAYEKTLMKSD